MSNSKKNVGSFAKRISLRLFSMYRRLQARKHDLAYLFWECTLRCNLSCLHCGSDCHTDSDLSDMERDDFIDVLELVSTTYDPAEVMVILTGGEPLLRDDLEECGKRFKKMGFSWGLVTNGWRVTQQRIDQLINAGLEAVTLSLDGLQASHNWLRNKEGSFRKATEAAAICAARPELVFDVVTCVNKHNINELEELKNLLITLGVKKWRLFNIFPRGRAFDNPELDISDEEFIDLLEFIKQTRKDEIVKTEYACEGFLGPYEGEVRDSFFWCRAGINIGSVLADGSISACPSMRGDFIQGNIYRDNFLDIWENKFQNMRDRSWTRSGMCKDCDVFNWCEGNGLHLHNEGRKDVMRCHYII